MGGDTSFYGWWLWTFRRYMLLPSVGSTLKMEVACYSETFVSTYETMRCHICIHNLTSYLSTLKMDTCSSETLITAYKTTRCHICLCKHIIVTLPTSTLKMEVACYSETLVSTHIPRRPQFEQSLLWRSIFWDITPCSALKVERRFGGTYRLHCRVKK
jgi:hypothetical protein